MASKLATKHQPPPLTNYIKPGYSRLEISARSAATWLAGGSPLSPMDLAGGKVRSDIDTKYCPVYNPNTGVQCNKKPGHRGAHVTPNGRRWIK